MKFQRLVVVSSLVALTGSVFLPSAGISATTGSNYDERLGAIEYQLDHKAGVDPKLLQEVGAILKAQPKNARAHFLLGKLYERSGFDTLAEQEFSKADELEPAKPQAVLELFLLKMQHDDFAAAWDKFGYLAKRFPNDPSLKLMKALILEGAHRDKDAEKVLDEALQSKEQRLGVATAAADIRLRQGRTQEAWKLVQQDLARDPNYRRANVVAGETLMQKREFAKAVPYLQKAWNVDPLDPTFVNVYASNLFHAGYFAKALEPALIHLAESTDPRQLAVAKQQIRVLRAKTSEAELLNALKAADAKVANTPWQGRLQLAMGDVFDSMNRRSLAEECYMKGIELLPLEGRAYYRLACDFEKDGQLNKALMLYEKAYELAPEDKQVLASYGRFCQRYNNRNNDIAWHLKDWMHKR